MPRVGIIQLTSSDDPAQNLQTILGYVRKAAAGGATFILTPEVSNCISQSRSHQEKVLVSEDRDLTLKALKAEAASLGVWLLIGSLALKTADADGRFANRSFLISSKGAIVARYDKIHMFDVDVTAQETFRESDGYRPGETAVVADSDFARIGMSVCYDVRFPNLYRQLARNGAQILTVPAAFSPVTGDAHWQTLLRARAIENGCFVLAPAQTGTHDVGRGKPRYTWGHSHVVAPWGEVLLDAGTEPGAYMVDLSISEVAKARGRVPSLTHDRDYGGPAIGGQ